MKFSNVYKFKNKVFSEPYAPYFDAYRDHVFQIIKSMNDGSGHVLLNCVDTPALKIEEFIEKDYLVEV